jgi:hypothetical protein
MNKTMGSALPIFGDSIATIADAGKQLLLSRNFENFIEY